MEGSILILAIGNDIMGDDEAPFEAAMALKVRFQDSIEIENVYGGGLEILDYIEGSTHTLILDTISTESNPVGTIVEFDKDDFQHIDTDSPYYLGLPEIIKLSTLFNIKFPYELKILAIETGFQTIAVDGFSEDIQKGLTELINKASEIINTWLNEE
jgi:hydrogenase maturation protease